MNPKANRENLGNRVAPSSQVEGSDVTKSSLEGSISMVLGLFPDTGLQAQTDTDAQA